MKGFNIIELSKTHKILRNRPGSHIKSLSLLFEHKKTGKKKCNVKTEMTSLPLLCVSRKVHLVQEVFDVVRLEMQMKKCEIQAHGQH